LLNEKEIIHENTLIFKNKNLIENKIDNLQANLSSNALPAISAKNNDCNLKNKINNSFFKNEVNKDNFESKEDEEQEGN